MKKANEFVASNKKISTEPHKQYVKKIRIYPAFLYGHLDKWLKRMSAKGLHIIHCGMFLFHFEKGEPAEKEYFTYGLPTQEGRYSISLRYPFLEKTYGLKDKKSKINSDKTKTYQILEVDLNKIDIKNDVGYKELINDRDRLYMRYFIRNLSIISAAVLVTIVLLLLL